MSIKTGVPTIHVRTPYCTKLKVNKTDVVTVCLFRIFTFKQIILNPVTVAKHLAVLKVLEYSCVVIFAKENGSTQPTTAAGDWSLFQHSGPLSCQLTYYAKLRPLVVFIHKEGLNVYK